MIVGVPRESFPGERRVALVPAAIPNLTKAGLEVVVEAGAGIGAGYPDADYAAKGAKIVADRAAVFRAADIVVQILCYGSNDKTGKADVALYKRDQVLIGFLRPLGSLETIQEIAAKGVTSFSVELMPRTTRAQSMDVLSSMATICGYKAVVLAADTSPREVSDLARAGVSFLSMELMPRITRAQSMDALSSMATIAGYRAVLMAAMSLPKIFPMLMTAAGTVTAARAFILGAGVAGLQAIATARRLGAVVSAYDVRSAVKEQIESLGGKFVVLNMEGGAAEGTGGYAKAMGEDFYKRQRELLTEVLREQDVVITTAAVPGKKAPILVTKEMASAMAPGSVIVDIAAERGGNCELTRPGETVMHQGITILGPLNVPSTIPYHASQMYASNITAFLKLMVQKGEFKMNREDEIIRETLVTHGKEVVHARVGEALGLSPVAPAGEGR
jgi:NAD(P) transhydrogenase subunit alpha